MKEGLSVPDFRGHEGNWNRRVVKRLNCRVAPCMVVMGVRVSHDYRDAGAVVALKPVMHDMLKCGREVAVARARVPEQSTILAEEEKEEWHLRIGASGLTKDV